MKIDFPTNIEGETHAPHLHHPSIRNTLSYTMTTLECQVCWEMHRGKCISLDSYETRTALQIQSFVMHITTLWHTCKTKYHPLLSVCALPGGDDKETEEEEEDNEELLNFLFFSSIFIYFIFCK